MAAKFSKSLVLVMLLLSFGLLLFGGANMKQVAAAEAAQPVSFGFSKQKNTANDQPVEIKFSEIYSGSSSRGLKFSDLFLSLDGKKVSMKGYMAPPLKPSLTFFVLTREPMSICPFCSTDASWPEDIVLIYLPKPGETVPGDAVLKVTGLLELGSYTDPDTGFVSQARIYAEEIEMIR
ncbi:MAG: hypothetical protein AB9907_09055 [Flexilinea sp.]